MNSFYSSTERGCRTNRSMINCSSTEVADISARLKHCRHALCCPPCFPQFAARSIIGGKSTRYRQKYLSKSFLSSLPNLATSSTVLWSAAADPSLSSTSGTSSQSLKYVRRLYIVNDIVPRSITPMQFLTSLGPAVTEFVGSASPTPPSVPFPALETLYVYLYKEDQLTSCAEILQRRAEAGYKPRLLFGSNTPGGSSRGVLKSWEQVETMLGDHVGTLIILGEQGYWDAFALRTVLPPACTEVPELGSDPPSVDTMCLWPPWTEGGETSNVLMLH
ncbi:hypothetical protein OH76DRAFT_1473404 [Lentinus brumalis]|uniref:Uncharacterized protein n=1 Tax=Lentinus brumalis TaxID=2498619 RepID=A0A371D203_9APHY|nr:hypothetical protein OH76DRAFT_1473404 [Polyporus brumalis]